MFVGCASGEPDCEYSRVRWECSWPLTFAKNETAVDPRGVRAVLVSGTGWVLGSARGAHPLPGPAVHSDGNTALHWAAAHGNRPVVRLLIASNAAVGAQNIGGCAVRLRHRRVRRPSPRRLPCRWTPLHYAASNGETDAIAELLVSGAAVAVRNIVG
jgi:hypothetical protein